MMLHKKAGNTHFIRDKKKENINIMKKKKMRIALYIHQKDIQKALLYPPPKKAVNTHFIRDERKKKT